MLAHVPDLLFGSKVQGILSAGDLVGSRDAVCAAGFDLVVPRSRMAREGAALIERLVG